MGRWGKTIYQSDAALDYHSIITARLERELAYWLSPEQVENHSAWLARVLAVIEAMLLFERHNIGSSAYINSEKALQRWREVFLSVWDGSWPDKAEIPASSWTRLTYNEPEYREQHRPAIIKMFDHLESVARYWTNLSDSSVQPELVPLPPEFPLPYFSIIRWTNRDNDYVVTVDRFTSELIELLLQIIIYWLSPEKRSEALAFNTEGVWVAVDTLGFLCQIYEQSPEVNEQVIRTWRDTTIQIWKQFVGADQADWDETDSLYQNVMDAFDRLEATARKYPPFDW